MRGDGGPQPEVLGTDITITLGDGRLVPHVNLDYAASPPCLRAAAEAVSELLPYYASVHRGAGALSQLCTARFEMARERVASFLSCRAEDRIVFTRNTTDSLNLLARVLPPRTTVVTFLSEHHANLLPWRRVLRLNAPRSAQEAVEAADAALRELRWNSSDPLLLAVSGASNVTGEIWPLASLTATAHRHGARIVVDAAQLAAHHVIDVADLDLDYVALSGHKLYAPFGVGVLAGRHDWLDDAPPYLAGGGATAHVGDRAGEVEWATGPARHEAGTPNVVGAVALAAACDALATAGLAAVWSREDTLATHLADGLSTIPEVRRLFTFGPTSERVGIVSFAVDGIGSMHVSAELARDHGVGVRDGLFCAHPLARRLLRDAGADATTAVRASVGLGSTARHVEQLVEGLRAIVAARRRPRSR